MAALRHSWVPFFPSDWLGGTGRMMRIHRSAYFDICCAIWDTAEPVSPLELRSMLADIPEWETVVEELLAVEARRELAATR